MVTDFFQCITIESNTVYVSIETKRYKRIEFIFICNIVTIYQNVPNLKAFKYENNCHVIKHDLCIQRQTRPLFILHKSKDLDNNLRINSIILE